MYLVENRSDTYALSLPFDHDHRPVEFCGFALRVMIDLLEVDVESAGAH